MFGMCAMDLMDNINNNNNNHTTSKLFVCPTLKKKHKFVVYFFVFHIRDE